MPKELFDNTKVRDCAWKVQKKFAMKPNIVLEDTHWYKEYNEKE